MNAQEFALPSMAEQGVLWRELQRRIGDSPGLLKKQYLYYSVKLLLTLCLFGASILWLVAMGNSWWHMANALLAGFVSGQMLLAAHSSGHGQVLASWRNNYAVSLAVGFLTGVSPSWWAFKHNDGHHKNPNNVDLDPDVRVSVLAFIEEQAFGKKGFNRAVVRYQHVFVFLILCLSALSFRGASIHYLLPWSNGELKVRYRLLEIAVLAAHSAGYILLLVFLLDSWLYIMVFTIVYQGFTGLYIGSLFAANHKGMRMFRKGDGVSFLLRQALPSRDVKNHWFFDFLFGGLNFQIEHHLFPFMAENKLREAQIIVRKFFKDYEIPYCETGVLDTFTGIWGHLRRVSAPLRDPILANASS
ncbi:MAG: fatty acid desaturase [Parcubacteria group bacterium Greene0416_39]|nr:MAG: fatty acid desaturase [Parcubacteria group bacterium Greene0416_39]